MNHPKTTKQRILNREIRLNIDMLQGHVTAICSSDKIACYAHQGTCSRDLQPGHIAGTKSQRSYTQENGAGTCLRQMLQDGVLTCELTLRGKLVSTNGTLSLGSMDFLASLRREQFVRREPRIVHVYFQMPTHGP